MRQSGSVDERGSDGSTAVGRLSAAGILFLISGENVGYGAGTSGTSALSAIEENLLNQASSRANVLYPAFTQVGIGAVYVNCELWLTEDFTGY
jgi:uncharacterized protein YkwD